METILDRIKKITIAEGITIAAFEKVIGASKGVISRALSNGTDIQAKWLPLIVDNYPHYSADWLLTGEGEMLRSSDRLSTAVSISSSSEWIDYLREKDADLRAAREELDSLREKVSELEHLLMEKGTAAGGAPLADIAPAI